MLIKKIYLEDFRSYAKKQFKFDPAVTLVVGPNTVGKSNLFEAIFLLAFGSSPWAGLDREMVRSGAKLGFARATVSSDGGKDQDSSIGLEVVLTESGKRFRVNGVGRRLADFSRHFHVVLFSPQDLNLVTGSPDLRRRFLDFALGSVDSGYARATREYDKVRKRRNRLLERINKDRASEEELGFWDAKLLEFGTFLQDERKKFFDEINKELGSEDLELKYILSGLTAERLLELRPREIAAETSLVGPHRDDFSFISIQHTANGEQQERDLAKYGSRSEQRRAVLALKEAELEFVEKKIGERPVLLLDDIFSELDEENRAKVSELFGGSLSADRQGQVIITTADIHYIPKALQKHLEIIKL